MEEFKTVTKEEIVGDLNDKVFEFDESLQCELGFIFSSSTFGYDDTSINIDKICLYHTENDEREYNDEKDDYAETEKEFVKRRFKELANKLNKFAETL